MENNIDNEREVGMTPQNPVSANPKSQAPQKNTPTLQHEIKHIHGRPLARGVLHSWILQPHIIPKIALSI